MSSGAAKAGPKHKASSQAPESLLWKPPPAAAPAQEAPLEPSRLPEPLSLGRTYTAVSEAQQAERLRQHVEALGHATHSMSAPEAAQSQPSPATTQPQGAAMLGELPSQPDLPNPSLVPEGAGGPGATPQQHPLGDAAQNPQMALPINFQLHQGQLQQLMAMQNDPAFSGMTPAALQQYMASLGMAMPGGTPPAYKPDGTPQGAGGSGGQRRSKAMRRGPMDEMRQLIRILTKIIPHSSPLVMNTEEGGGGNRISEDQIKHYLDSTLGEGPRPIWGVPNGWGNYLAELFGWVLDRPIDPEAARNCAKREPGRSWEAKESDLNALGLFPNTWPLPLSKATLRQAHGVAPLQPYVQPPKRPAPDSEPRAQPASKRRNQGSIEHPELLSEMVIWQQIQRLLGAAHAKMVSGVALSDVGPQAMLVANTRAQVLQELFNIAAIGCTNDQVLRGVAAMGGASAEQLGSAMPVLIQTPDGQYQPAFQVAPRALPQGVPTSEGGDPSQPASQQGYPTESEGLLPSQQGLLASQAFLSQQAQALGALSQQQQAQLLQQSVGAASAFQPVPRGGAEDPPGASQDGGAQPGAPRGARAAPVPGQLTIPLPGNPTDVLGLLSNPANLAGLTPEQLAAAQQELHKPQAVRPQAEAAAAGDAQKGAGAEGGAGEAPKDVDAAGRAGTQGASVPPGAAPHRPLASKGAAMPEGGLFAGAQLPQQLVGFGGQLDPATMSALLAQTNMSALTGMSQQQLQLYLQQMQQAQQQPAAQAELATPAQQAQQAMPTATPAQQK